MDGVSKVTMRTNRFVLATVALALAASPAAADSSVAGVYDVKYDEVSTNCQSPLRYPHGKLELKVTRGTSITIDIDRTPIMQGSVGKKGNVSAKSRSGPTSLEGMNGVFSIAGKISPEGMLTLTMVGEYSAGGKPLCSQSWNVVGSKTDAPATKGKKSSTDLELFPAMFPTLR
jgi:hypothetical protein